MTALYRAVRYKLFFFQLLIVISNLLRYSGLRFTYVSFRHAKVVILYMM